MYIRQKNNRYAFSHFSPYQSLTSIRLVLFASDNQKKFFENHGKREF